MQAAAPETRLRQIWQQLTAQLGAFARQDGAEEQVTGGFRSVVVQCVFAKATADLVVSRGQDGTIAGFHVTNVQPLTAAAYTPPSYVHTTAFHERAVTVGGAPWALPGTLTLPNGPGPFPAVVLVAGSGPEDRDETIAGNKPFRDLAWGLASQGIAVLRYDKRTLVYGARIAGLADFTAQDEFVDDAAAAVQLMARTPGIEGDHIYVLGHSEGAMMAPLIAERAPQVAGLIVMAGPTRPLVDVIVGQFVYLQSRGLATAAQVATAKAQAAAIEALTPADRGRGGNLLGAPPAYWLSLRGYRPAAVARHLTIPLLIMQGARDYQVTLADFAGWKAALAAHPRVTFKLYANLFHPFLPVPPGSPPGLATPGAYAHPGHVDPPVIHDIVTWLRVL
jgi:dienelactone hydrolase